MRLTIDTDSNILTVQGESKDETMPLYSRRAFELISDQWLRVGWNEKYVYTFSWLGRPLIQLPEDVIRIQEVIYHVKPDVIVETGVAHGGSLVLYASLCKAMDKGRVIGVDIEIRDHNRTAIESHLLFPLISLIEGSSIEETTVQQVRALIKPGERVLVILDSNHTKAHVLEELKLYHPFVNSGSYIVATDGSMKDLHDVPRGNDTWRWDHPEAAAAEFAATHPEFLLEQPPWPFNESKLGSNITHWPGAWLRRI